MDDVESLSKGMDRTRTRINNIVRDLRRKGIPSDSERIGISADPFATGLLNIMRPSREIPYHVLNRSLLQ